MRRSLREEKDEKKLQFAKVLRDVGKRLLLGGFRFLKNFRKSMLRGRFVVEFVVIVKL